MSEEAVNFQEGDSLTVNLAEVEDTAFELLPNGSYPCLIAECEFTYSQASGNPMWTLKLEVAEGEFAGRTLYTHLVWAGKGLGMTKQTIGRIAPELLEAQFDCNDEEVIGSMLGKDVTAKVTSRKWDGQMRNNVAGLFAGGGDGFA